MNSGKGVGAARVHQRSSTRPAPLPVKQAKPWKRTTEFSLTGKDANRIIWLLGDLQTHLESCLDSVILPGESEPHDPRMRPEVTKLRKEWREAENLIKLLGGRS